MQPRPANRKPSCLSCDVAYAHTGELQGQDCPVKTLGLATEQHPIKAVLVMTDPR